VFEEKRSAGAIREMFSLALKNRWTCFQHYQRCGGVEGRGRVVGVGGGAKRGGGATRGKIMCREGGGVINKEGAGGGGTGGWGLNLMAQYSRTPLGS